VEVEFTSGDVSGEVKKCSLFFAVNLYSLLMEFFFLFRFLYLCGAEQCVFVLGCFAVAPNLFGFFFRNKEKIIIFP